MTIYSFSNVTKFLEDFELDTVYYNKRESQLKSTHLDIYNEILLYTSFLINPTFIERLYCYTNKITSVPLCKMCTNKVTLSKRGNDRKYHTYCKGKCARDDFITLIGAENPSTKQEVKDKKVTTSRKNHGVDYPTQTSAARKNISKKAKARWKQRIKDLIESIQDKTMTLTRKQYNKIVDQITERMFNEHPKLPDRHIRGRWYQLDHIVSKCYGFQNKIPPEIIGDINNLQIIPRSMNARKQFRNGMTIVELYEKYNSYYSVERIKPEGEEILFVQPKPDKSKTRKTPVLLVEPILTNTGQKCCICKAPAKFKIGKEEKSCCSASFNSCPGKKAKYLETIKDMDLAYNKSKKIYNNGEIQVINLLALTDLL